MSAKVKITFVMPEGLQQEMREKIVMDGYGLRGKSKWAEDAIIRLLDLKDYVEELVYLSDKMKGFEKPEMIAVSNVVKDRLDQAILEIRKIHPTLEGVQSRIIRTSIMQRILRF